MPYSPSTAAREIIAQTAAQLAALGYSTLQDALGLTVTHGGAPGVAFWTYAIIAKNGAGLPLSALAITTPTGNATLTGVDTNIIGWGAVAGAASYDVYRLVSGGSPATVGKIGSIAGLTFTDTGLAGDGVVLGGIANPWNNMAPVDGWLRPAVEAQATTFNLAAQAVAAGAGWTTLTSSEWSVTPYCPRPLLLTCSISGFVSAPGNDTVQVRLRFGGVVIATMTCGVNPIDQHITLPTLKGIVAAASVTYPLAAQTVDVQVSPGGANWNINIHDVVSYSLS